MYEYAQHDATYMEKKFKTSVKNGLSDADVQIRRDPMRDRAVRIPIRTLLRGFLSSLCGELSFFVMLAAIAFSVFFLPITLVVSVGTAYLLYLILLLWLYIRRERGNARLAFSALPYVCVIRNGKKSFISPYELVEGDLLFLRTGDVLYADAYIVTDDAVEVVCEREGIRETLVKHGGICFEGGEAFNLLFSGDVLRAGSCLAIVVHTERYEPRAEENFKSYTERSQSRLCRMSVRLSLAISAVALLFSFFFLRDAILLSGVLLCIAILLSFSPASWCELLFDVIFLARNRRMLDKHRASFSSMQSAEEMAKVNCYLLPLRSVFHGSKYVVRAFESGTGVRIGETSAQNTQELSLISAILLGMGSRYEGSFAEQHLLAFCKRHIDKDLSVQIGNIVSSPEHGGISLASIHAADGRAFSFVGADPEFLLPYMISVSENGRTRLLDKRMKDAISLAIRRMKRDGYKLVAYAETQTRVYGDDFPPLSADMKLLGILVLSEVPDKKIERTLACLMKEGKKAFFFHDGDDPSWITDNLPILRNVPILDAKDADLMEKMRVFASTPELPFAIGLHFSPVEQSKLAHLLNEAGYVTLAAGEKFADHRMMCAASVALAPLKSRSNENIGIVHASASAYTKVHIASEVAAVQTAEKLLHTFGVLTSFLCTSLLARSIVFLIGVFFGQFLLTPLSLVALSFVVDFAAFSCLSRVFSVREDASDIESAKTRNLGLLWGTVLGALTVAGMSLLMLFFADAFRFSHEIFALASLLLMLNVGIWRFSSAKPSGYSVLFTLASLLLTALYFCIELFRGESSSLVGELPYWVMIPTIVLFSVGKGIEELVIKQKMKFDNSKGVNYE